MRRSTRDRSELVDSGGSQLVAGNGDRGAILIDLDLAFSGIEQVGYVRGVDQIVVPVDTEI